MPDLKYILNNRKEIEKNCKERNARLDFNALEKFISKRAELLLEVEKMRARSNQIASEMQGAGKIDKENFIVEGQKIKKDLKVKEDELRIVEADLRVELYKIPNTTHPKTPRGQSDKDNVEVRKIGEAPKFAFKPKDHVELGKNLDILDFDSGAKTSGNKFHFLKNDGVLLELALIQYAMEILIKEGFEIHITPELAKLDIIEGIGFSPRGPEAQIYTIEEEDLGLIATAEITLGGKLRNEILSIDTLPLKLGGLSHCFRKEAGTYGKASKGLYRVHQFTKVEMFIFCLPEDSDKMLDHLVDIEVKIFSGLEIPFRIVDCCTGDLGGAAYRKFDLEAWMPGDNRWGEVTSASNCTDYQARRLNIKYKGGGSKKAEYIHTLNATALATSRAIIAILENFQEKDGSVRIPKALQKFMGIEKILPKK